MWHYFSLWFLKGRLGLQSIPVPNNAISSADHIRLSALTRRFTIFWGLTFGILLFFRVTLESVPPHTPSGTYASSATRALPVGPTSRFALGRFLGTGRLESLEGP